MASPGALNWEEEMQEVKGKIQEVEKKLKTLEEEIEEAKKKPGYTTDSEYKRATKDLARKEVILAELLKKENLLRSQGAAGPRPSSAAGGAGPGPSSAAAEHERVAARCKTASKYCGHVEVHGNRGAVTVVSPHEAVTYAHGDHDAWRLGDLYEVLFNDEKSDARKKVPMRVVHKRPRLDMVTLQLEDVGCEQLSAPPLDAGISPGEPYVVVGCSATHQLVDPASVGHGSIASTSPDADCHIRGDTPPSLGDSGGGCFSVETGKLIAVCVGRENVPSVDDPQGPRVPGQKAVLVPIMAVLEGLLPEQPQ